MSFTTTGGMFGNEAVGTAAFDNTGTSGATIPLLNGTTRTAARRTSRINFLAERIGVSSGERKLFASRSFYRQLSTTGASCGSGSGAVNSVLTPMGR